MTIKISDLPDSVQVVAANLLASEISNLNSSWPEDNEQKKNKADEKALVIRSAFLKLFSS